MTCTTAHSLKCITQNFIHTRREMMWRRPCKRYVCDKDSSACVWWNSIYVMSNFESLFYPLPSSAQQPFLKELLSSTICNKMHFFRVTLFAHRDSRGVICAIDASLIPASCGLEARHSFWALLYLGTRLWNITIQPKGEKKGLCLFVCLFVFLPSDPVRSNPECSVK